MNKHIGLAIVTYTINYGSFLQAFATQAALIGLGYETEILNINSVINDVSRKRKKYFIKQIFNVPELNSYRNAIFAIVAEKFNQKYKKYIANRKSCFKKFCEDHFIIGEICDSWEGLSTHCNKYSSVIVGSDQLWRPANIAGDFYTLNFVPDHINKISYATSFGLNDIRNNQKDIAASFLKRIQHLSCREENGVEIIERLTGRNAKVVCDPTLLLKKGEWDSFIPQEPIVEGNYVLTYFLGDNKKHREYAKQLAQKTSCKVVGVLHCAGYVKNDENYADEIPANVGPFEFLNLIKYSMYVCTDSFHGCVFSTLFEKNFYAFKRFSDKDKMSTNTRVIGLLGRLELSHRMVEDYDFLFLDKINYTKVNEKVDEFRNDSLNFLTTALAHEDEVF